MKKIIFLILAMFTLVSCATIFTGTKQSVIFTASEGTKFYVDGRKIAEIPAGYDSVSITVDRNINGLDMVAKKDGYRDAHFHVKATVNGVVFVNILVGAVWGAVDIATGAAVRYPNYVEVEMHPLN